MSQVPPSNQPVYYHYHQPTSYDSIRRHSSRLPSNMSAMSRSSFQSISTIDDISKDRNQSDQLDETQASEDGGLDNYHTYSSIPDNVFSVPTMPSSSAQAAQYYVKKSTFPTHLGQGNAINFPSYQTTNKSSESQQSPRHRHPDLKAQFYSADIHNSSTSSLADSYVSSANSSVISCIYTGKLPDPAVLLKNRRKLLEMAVKHNFTKLVKACEKSYLLTLQVSNCLESLLVVDNFLPNSEVRQTIINFIRVNLEEVMKEANWDKFIQHCDELVNEIWPLQKQE